MATPIDAPCVDRFPALNHGGALDPSGVLWAVIHDTEGGTAESVARYFATSPQAFSAHLVVDDGACYRCVRDDVIAYHAAGANDRSVGCEIVGFARWLGAAWVLRRRRLKRAAWQVARWCRRFGLPVEYVDAAGLLAGRKGITTHRQVSLAFHKSSHSDPGLGFPRQRFLRYVRAAYALQD